MFFIEKAEASLLYQNCVATI